MDVKRGLVASLFLLVLAFITNVYAEYSVALSWCPSCQEVVTGYNVYKGEISRNYNETIEVSGVNNCYSVVSGLEVNRTYFLSAKAHDDSGNESDYSNEITVCNKEDGTNLLSWFVVKGIPPYTDVDGLLEMSVFYGDTGLATSKIDLSSISKDLRKIGIKFKATPTGEPPYFVFVVSTKLGTRNIFFKFDPVKPVVGGSSNIVGAIWSDKRDGQWHYENINLGNIVATVQPGNEIIKYALFFVYTYSPTAIASLMFDSSPDNINCSCP